MTTATIHTTHGPVVVELYDEDAPKTVENFAKLSRDGFYDGITFHPRHPRLHDPGRLPQGGRHAAPGYEFEDEANDHGVVRGALAMANRGPNTNGSQFFIVTTQAAPWLDGEAHRLRARHRGMEVVDAISEVERDAGDRPLEAVTIQKGWGRVDGESQPARRTSHQPLARPASAGASRARKTSTTPGSNCVLAALRSRRRASSTERRRR